METKEQLQLPLYKLEIGFTKEGLFAVDISSHGKEVIRPLLDEADPTFDYTNAILAGIEMFKSEMDERLNQLETYIQNVR